jgi:hypothetical protein
MEFQMSGNGSGFEMRLHISWHSARACIKALLPVIAALVGLFAAPELGRLSALIGW